eukprot:4953391-Prymnesium_polylepis.1
MSFLQLTHPRIPTDVAGLNCGARGRGKRVWRRRSWTYTDALSKARMASISQFCNVSRGDIFPRGLLNRVRTHVAHLHGEVAFGVSPVATGVCQDWHKIASLLGQEIARHFGRGGLLAGRGAGARD